MALCGICGRPASPALGYCASCLKNADHSRIHATDSLCTTCYFIGEAGGASWPLWPGFALMLLYIFPGIIYFVFRAALSKKACASCQSTEIIPALSPRARQLLAPPR